VLLGLVVLAVAPSGAVAKPNPVLPPTAHPHGQSYSAWAAEWWQWALGESPATSPLLDPTGANCANGQEGKVWFLAGTIVSGPVERSCTVPTGTTLVFPVVNEFSCADPGEDEDDIRAEVADVGEATDLTASIDGATVRNVAAYYEESVVFSIELPEENIFDTPDLDVPGGTYEPCVDAGYYLAVRPLPPGEHTIRFGGSVSGLVVDVTYHITVAPRHR
jgi:hypothetical protein